MIEKSGTWPELARQAAATGVAEKVECVPAWNNQGQEISHRGRTSNPVAEQLATVAIAPGEHSATPAADAQVQQADNVSLTAAKPAQENARQQAPKRDYEAEYQAKLRVWEQQQADHRRMVDEHEAAKRQVEALKQAQKQQVEGVLDGHQRQLAEHAAKVAAFEEEHRRWENAVRQAQGLSAHSGSSSGIADAFKAQNDAERAKVEQGLPEPAKLDGYPWVYCYQPSPTDSTLYHTRLFNSLKSKTELELSFADAVARITRIGAGMSTLCHISTDPSYLNKLRENVRNLHAKLTPKILPSPM